MPVASLFEFSNRSALRTYSSLSVAWINAAVLPQQLPVSHWNVLDETEQNREFETWKCFLLMIMDMCTKMTMRAVRFFLIFSEWELLIDQAQLNSEVFNFSRMANRIEIHIYLDRWNGVQRDRHIWHVVLTLVWLPILCHTVNTVNRWRKAIVTQNNIIHSPFFCNQSLMCYVLPHYEMTPVRIILSHYFSIIIEDKESENIY